MAELTGLSVGLSQNIRFQSSQIGDLFIMLGFATGQYDVSGTYNRTRDLQFKILRAVFACSLFSSAEEL